MLRKKGENLNKYYKKGGLFPKHSLKYQTPQCRVEKIAYSINHIPRVQVRLSWVYSPTVCIVESKQKRKE